MSEKTRKAEAGYQRLIRTGDPKTAVLSVRITPADRDAIAALALELGITQSDLIARKVLGKMSDQLEARLLRAEARIARLERKTYGIALSDDEIDRDLGLNSRPGSPATPARYPQGDDPVRTQPRATKDKTNATQNHAPC